MPPTGWRIVVSSVVVVVVLCTAGSCLSSTVVQAENERKAAVARQERISVFIIESLFGLLLGGGRGFLFFGVRRNWRIDEGPGNDGTGRRASDYWFHDQRPLSKGLLAHRTRQGRRANLIPKAGKLFLLFSRRRRRCLLLLNDRSSRNGHGSLNNNFGRHHLISNLDVIHRHGQAGLHGFE